VLVITKRPIAGKIECMAHIFLSVSPGRTATFLAESTTAASRPRPLPRTAPPLWRELVLIALFYGAYSLTRLLVNPDGTTGAFAHADQVLAFERRLGLDVELGLNQALLSAPWLARAANVFYACAHFLITLAVAVWLYRRRPEHYRWFRTSLIVATTMALIGFWAYPLAPPRFLSDHGFVDPVTALHTVGLYSAPGSGTLANQYAAMPSMHAGWALWCGFVLVRLGTHRWVKVLGMLYPATTVFVILATANHYVLDAMAGTALTAAALSGAWAVYRGGVLSTKERGFVRGSDLRTSRPAFAGDTRPVRV
jgi:hypothetical protein